MELVVNGAAMELSGPASVAELVERLELLPPRIAVEVNERLVRRAEYADTLLQDGDRVEIVTLVGGG